MPIRSPQQMKNLDLSARMEPFVTMLEEAFAKTVKDRLFVATEIAKVADLHFGPQSKCDQSSSDLCLKLYPARLLFVELVKEGGWLSVGTET